MFGAFSIALMREYVSFQNLLVLAAFGGAAASTPACSSGGSSAAATTQGAFSSAATGGGGGAGTGGAGASGGGAPETLCDLYAAPDGSGQDCSIKTPCTLDGTRDRARRLAPTMATDLRIGLRGGEYLRPSTFELSGELDSGQNGHEIIYESYPGQHAVLSCAVPIQGFKPVASGIYRAPTPAGLETRQLYVNGVRAERARCPLNPPGFAKTPLGYTAPNASMAAYKNQDDIEIVAFRYWKSYRCGVASISGAAITMDSPCWALS
jgi:hypothetical protein